MTTGGWITMIGSVGFVTLLFGWTIFKVLATPGATEHLRSSADIDPHDQEPD